MQWLADHAVQLAFLFGYLALIAHHAWQGNRKAKSLSDYLVGGRSIGGVVIALSYYATFVSSVTFVGHAGRSYTLGPSWWLTCIVVFCGVSAISWFVVAPRFVTQAKAYESLTIPDFLGARYDSMLIRRLAGVVVVGASLAYMAAVFNGAAEALGSLLHLPPEFVYVLIFFVVTGYTLAGGFHSVVSTDAVQGLILFTAAMVLPVSMVWQMGGITPLLSTVRANNPEALTFATGQPLFQMIGLALGVGMKILVEPRQLSRFYGLASMDELKKGRWIAPSLLICTYASLLPVGFLAWAFVKPEQLHDPNGKVITDQLVPFLLSEVNLIGLFAGAFFLTGLVAAAMSSLDSVLLVAASSTDHDVVAPGRDPHVAVRFTRIWVVILSSLAVLLSYFVDRGIVEMSSFSGSMYAACFLPTLVGGIFWKRGTAPAALVSLVVGFFITAIWFIWKKVLFGGEYAWLHEMYVGLATTLPLYVVISLATSGQQSHTSPKR